MFLSIHEGNMLIHIKFFVWGAYNYKQMPKMELRNIVYVYSNSSKNQTKSGWDLKNGLNDC